MRLVSQPVSTWRAPVRAAAQAEAAPEGGGVATVYQAGRYTAQTPAAWEQALAHVAAEARRFIGQLAAPAPESWDAGLPVGNLAPAPVAQPAPAPQPKPAPAPKAQPKPEPKPQPKPKPKPQAKPDPLKTLSAAELAHLGATDKRKFFEVLRPAAEASERAHGVPAAITLAQAALETGWGKSIIPGFNIFGIKGTGPAGTVKKGTWEVYNGKTVTITANFAKYHHFKEAVEQHGKRFHNGYYDKALANWKRYHDPQRFARDITGVYATDPQYGNKLISIMKTYDLI